MGINKYNCEGYYDPTPYEALTRIENEARKLHSFRPVVYICSPLSGDVEGNQEKAARYCRFAVDTGYIPIAPHLYFPRFMTMPTPESGIWPSSWTLSCSPNAPSSGCSEEPFPRV